MIRRPKKLALDRTTLVQLDRHQLRAVAGGVVLEQTPGGSCLNVSCRDTLSERD